MIAPLIIAGGIAIASGISQYMNSKDARSQSQANLDKLRALYDKVSQPNFDESKITPDEYQVLQKYVPQQAEYVAEKNPTLVEGKSEGAVAGRQAQMQALQGLMQAGQGHDPSEQAALSNTLQQASSAANANQQALLQGAQRRGMLNSGMQLASQLQAGSDQMGRAAQTGNQQLMQAYQARLQALQAGAGLGGQIRNEDIGLESQNAGVLNAFNQRTAAGQQTYQNRFADTANQGQLFNINQTQDIANKNTTLNNSMKQYNKESYNQIQQNKFSDQIGQISGQTPMVQAQNSNYVGSAADKNSAIQGVTNVGTTGAMAAYNNNNKKPKDTGSTSVDNGSDEEED